VVRPFFDEAIATLDARDDWMLMQDNGPSVGKTSFFRMEFVNGTPPTAARPHIFDMKNSGQTGIMLIKLHAMPPPKELERRLLWLYQMLPKNLQRHDDQTLILSAFEGKFSLFTMCLPFHVVEVNMSVAFRWSLARCKCEIAPHYVNCNTGLSFFHHDHHKVYLHSFLRNATTRATSSPQQVATLPGVNAKANRNN